MMQCFPILNNAIFERCLEKTQNIAQTMNMNNVFLQKTVKCKILLFIETLVYLFNSRISKTVQAHSETSNITKNIALFA